MLRTIYETDDCDDFLYLSMDRKVNKNVDYINICVYNVLCGVY